MAAKRPLRVGLNVPFADAIAQAARRGVVLPSTYYGVLQGVARAQAFSIAGITAIDQLVAVRDSLVEALAEGTSFRDWREQVTTGKRPLNLPRHRLETIFRTNVQTAYNRGLWEQQKAIAATHRFLMYDAVNDSRTRPAHGAMDGFIARADDPVWRTWYPPNGYNCRCTTIALTLEEAQRRGLGTPKPPGVFPDEGWNSDLREAPLTGLDKAWQDRLAKLPRAMAVVGDGIRRKAKDLLDGAA